MRHRLFNYLFVLTIVLLVVSILGLLFWKPPVEPVPAAASPMLLPVGGSHSL